MLLYITSAVRDLATKNTFNLITDDVQTKLDTTFHVERYLLHEYRDLREGIEWNQIRISLHIRCFSSVKFAVPRFDWLRDLFHK